MQNNNNIYSVKLNASIYYNVRLALAANVVNLEKNLVESVRDFGRNHEITKSDYRELRDARRVRNSFCSAEVSLRQNS